MKIIIVGNGKTGFYLADQLSRDGHDVTVVDKDSAQLKKSDNTQDVITYNGDALDADVLREADVSSANLLIALTSSDQTNLLCCMLAREMGAPHTIARVRDPKLLQGLSVMWNTLGLSLSVNPELEAATEISRQLILPADVKVDFFAKGRVEMVEYTIPEGSPLCGIRLPQLTQKLKMQILVCAAVRGGEVLIPDGSYTITAGDRIGIAGSPSEIAKFFRLIDPTRKKAKTVVIVGGSTVSYYLARLLHENNLRVCIVEKDKERAEYLADVLPHANVTLGDGSDEEMLREEGLDGADALVALTAMDQENIVISMSARERGVAKVITKIDHTQLSGIISKVNIRNVVTPHLIAAAQVQRYVRAMQSSLASNVEALSSIMDGKAEALEFKVTEAFRGAGVPLRELRPKKGYLIACIIRKRQTIFPRGEDSIHPGDSVIVVTTHVGLNNLGDIME
ncbi:MAG: Trk system potassium transporter TrkA [Clostridia bacterium]|nr:Trk system potassium transporter TrkA [Clostridia bacterium]